MNARRNVGGFTLIELMVVVIIIAALAGMVLPRVLPASDQAKSHIAKGDIANISVALKLYRLHNERFPSTEEGLAVLFPKHLEKPARDPWKRDYRYRSPSSRAGMDFDLWSEGPDGVDGSGDDITSWGD